MRIIFIRHGEPDYRSDGLTENGKLEAQALAQRIKNWDVDAFYVSPLGRAQETAEPTLSLQNRTATTLPWLREYSYPVINPNHHNKSVAWDFVPSHFTTEPKMLSMEEWVDAVPNCDQPLLKENLHIVWDSLDKLLEEYGYVRDGMFYRNKNREFRHMTSTVRDNCFHVANELPYEDGGQTIVMFCHFGVSCLMLSHLLNIPFELLAMGFVFPTGSVTIANTEERWDNESYFRLQTTGDVSHLLNAGVKISSAGSFTPLFDK